MVLANMSGLGRLVGGTAVGMGRDLECHSALLKITAY
jgi:hypothetical protein